MIIISCKDKYQDFQCIFHHPHEQADLADHIPPLVCLEQTALIRKQPVRQHGIPQIHQIKDVQVHSGGEITLNEVIQERHQEQSHHCDCQTYDPVEGTIETHQSTDGRGIVFSDRLVHAEHHSAAHAKLRQIQKRQNRLEQAVQPQIFSSQILQHNGTNDERKQHIDYFHGSVKHNVSCCVPSAFKLHGTLCSGLFVQQLSV